MLAVSYMAMAQINIVDKSLLDTGNDATEIHQDTIEKVVEICEKMPRFKGNIGVWLASNLKYPKTAMKNGIQGKVIIRFIVRKDGSVTDAKVVKSVDPLIDSEVLRCVKSMPKWEPGLNNGTPVSVFYSLPINFRL